MIGHTFRWLSSIDDKQNVAEFRSELSCAISLLRNAFGDASRSFWLPRARGK